MMLKCPVCGAEVEVKCSDSPEPFTAYDPFLGLDAYGPASAEKELLHEGSLGGYRALHIRLKGSGGERLVLLPRMNGDGLDYHPLCEKMIEEHLRALDKYEEHCFDCCLETGGIDELCLCDCSKYDEFIEDYDDVDDYCEEEWECEGDLWDEIIE